jgi:ClpP class serine protease
MRAYPRLWSRLYCTPLLVSEDKAKVIEEVFRAHLGGEGTRVRLMDDDYPAETEAQRQQREHERRSAAYSGIALQNKPEKPYALTQSGIALIPVLGTLIQRGSWMDAASGLTSYDSVAALLDRALSDPDVRGAVLEIDSPGGEAAGVMDLAGRIASASKPVWASASEQAYSAAYWLAASAARVYVPTTGGVGSIGAVMLHVDQSKRDSQMGYAVTVIRSGARKAETNSREPLSPTAAAWLQAEVDRVGGLFAGEIAKYRGLSADAVLELEGSLLTPPQAVEGNYVDGIASLVQTVALLEQALGQGVNAGTRLAAGRITQSTSPKETTMKNASPAAIAVAAALGIAMESISEANGVKLEAAIVQHTDAARVEAKADGEKAGEAKGKEAGRVEATAAERARVKAIMAHDEAKERPALAMSIALETELSVEQAAKLLAGAPKQASGLALAALMASVPNPKVGTDAGADPAAGAPKLDTASVYAARSKAA